jgi:hypothetical protein
MPGDLKRAEQFKLEKEDVVGSEEGESKRASFFFDAEKDKADVGKS